MDKRRIGVIGFLFFVCICLLPFRAQAVSTSDAAEPISTQTACSLTLSYLHDGTPFSDVPVKLYKIADVSAESYYSLTPAFRSSGLVLNGIQSAGEWDVIRSTLESYILAHAIKADTSAATDLNGQVRFEPLEPGLYLAIADEVVQDGLHCIFSPALVNLPGLGANGLWQYQIAVTAKGEVLPPIEPDETVQLKILKLWKGETNRTVRPQSIEVEIFRNGASYKTVILSEENHWSYTWTTEDVGADWMVVERNVPPGYTMTLEERTTTFILTNTQLPDEPPSEDPSKEDPPPVVPPKGPTPTDSPKTGDTPHILLYTILMYVSGVILILLGITGKKKHV